VPPVELDDVPRELVRGVDLRRTGRDPLARERADEVAQLALLRGQVVPRHGAILFGEFTDERADCRAETGLDSLLRGRNSPPAPWAGGVVSGSYASRFSGRPDLRRTGEPHHEAKSQKGVASHEGFPRSSRSRRLR